ncbi:hypothetical protein TIFTF001_037392 [Ficus carica]|uniref:Uncharacterized protein n=1 Tax=Ficus carica TaxID=3494 RepID=A0AA88JC24_FICCA|nr:hypothetical protein TIFTF001_037392 [Ficus carica]
MFPAFFQLRHQHSRTALSRRNLTQSDVHLSLEDTSGAVVMGTEEAKIDVLRRDEAVSSRLRVFHSYLKHTLHADQKQQLNGLTQIEILNRILR